MCTLSRSHLAKSLDEYPRRECKPGGTYRLGLQLLYNWSELTVRNFTMINKTSFSTILTVSTSLTRSLGSQHWSEMRYNQLF